MISGREIVTKIVVLSRRNITHPMGGGASRYVHEIFRRLAEHYHIKVLSEGATSSSAVQEIDGVTYINARGHLLRFQLPFDYFRKFAGEADILVDNADVAIPWLSPLFARKPVILLVHQLAREAFYEELPGVLATLAYFSEPAIYGLYARSRIVAVSKSTAQDLCLLGVPRENIQIIGQGCPYPAIERVPLAVRSQRLIGYVSRLMRYKGVQFAIRAIAKIVKEFPDVRLEVAGSGPYARELRKLATYLNVGANVAFLGRVAEERKLKLYCESRAVIQSSVREGYGISVLEANCVGTPVVGWNVPGLRDSIINNATGLLASFPNVDDLARQIYSIMTDDSAWNSLSEGAWKWANSHSWDRSAQHFGNLIESVLVGH